MQFAPGANLEQINSLSELQRKSATAEDAVRIIRCFFTIDIRDRAPLETDNHILLEPEPAFRRFFDELREFVPRR